MALNNSTPKRLALGFIGLLILGGLWFAFRPEKLFLDQKVNEISPAQAADQLKPLLTGRFVGEVHKTTGLATVYQLPDGTRSLRLTDFATSNGPDLHVLLIDGNSADASKDFSLTTVRNVELGALKGNQGNQEYSIPNDADLKTFRTAAIYCERFHANFGVATLSDLSAPGK
jgi:Electron transfer DM13